jgi:transcriptional regulator with XRE-family HTH domain
VVRIGGGELTWLLRTWRTEVAVLSQATVAEHVQVAKGTLGMWESGSRRPAFAQLEALDACYGAGGALVDLALALGSPRGLDPRHIWAHNPQGPSAPHWAWLRPVPGEGWVEALLRWAAFGQEVAEPAGAGDRGVFVTTPVSMPNPAVWIRLARPGWVDFGRGTPPRELGIPILPALAGAQVAGGGHSAAGLVAPHIVERFVADPVFARAVLQFFGDRPDLVTQVFSTRQGWDRVARISPPVPDPTAGEAAPGAAMFRRLREARALSLADAAKLATAMFPEQAVHADQVRGVENGRRPRTRYVRARLDAVYRADGHLCRDEVPVTEGPATSADVRVDVEIPAFWVGPVWFSLVPQGRARTGRVRLEWGSDIKHMVFDGAATISCRRATHDAEHVSLFCPRGWQVTAGMGDRPDARDVNFGWLRKNDPGLEPAAPEDVNEIFLNWFGRTRDDFRRFLAHPEAW